MAPGTYRCQHSFSIVFHFFFFSKQKLKTQKCTLRPFWTTNVAKKKKISDRFWVVFIAFHLRKETIDILSHKKRKKWECVCVSADVRSGGTVIPCVSHRVCFSLHCGNVCCGVVINYNQQAGGVSFIWIPLCFLSYVSSITLKSLASFFFISVESNFLWLPFFFLFSPQTGKCVIAGTKIHTHELNKRYVIVCMTSPSATA